MLLEVGEWCVVLGGGSGMERSALALVVDALTRFAVGGYRLAITAAALLATLLFRFAQHPPPSFSVAQTGSADGTETAKTTIQVTT